MATESMTLAGLVAELKAARTAWHEDGVPISEKYAQFLDAIGNLTDEVERAIAESQVLASGLRFTFECGCAATFWAENGQLKGGLSCCKLHEANGQTLANILGKCPMLLVRIGTVAA